MKRKRIPWHFPSLESKVITEPSPSHDLSNAKRKSFAALPTTIRFSILLSAIASLFLLSSWATDAFLVSGAKDKLDNLKEGYLRFIVVAATAQGDLIDSFGNDLLSTMYVTGESDFKRNMALLQMGKGFSKFEIALTHIAPALIDLEILPSHNSGEALRVIADLMMKEPDAKKEFDEAMRTWEEAYRLEMEEVKRVLNNVALSKENLNSPDLSKLETEELLRVTKRELAAKEKEYIIKGKDRFKFEMAAHKTILPKFMKKLERVQKDLEKKVEGRKRLAQFLYVLGTIISTMTAAMLYYYSFRAPASNKV